MFFQYIQLQLLMRKETLKTPDIVTLAKVWVLASTLPKSVLETLIFQEVTLSAKSVEYEGFPALNGGQALPREYWLLDHSYLVLMTQESH